MTSPEFARWMRASEALRRRFRGRRDREELEELLDALERAALVAGRELALYEYADQAKGPPLH